MNVKILGKGCANCHRLEQLTREAAAGAHIDATVEHVTDMAAILGYGVMKTPGLVIDEKVVSTGRVPSKDEIAGWLRSASPIQH